MICRSKKPDNEIVTVEFRGRVTVVTYSDGQLALEVTSTDGTRYLLLFGEEETVEISKCELFEWL